MATHFPFRKRNLKNFLVSLIVWAGFGFIAGSALGNAGLGILLGGVAGLAFGAGLMLRVPPSADDERN
jgi:hypothetical protein